MAKAATAAEKRNFSRVADLGCIICGGIANIHHCHTHMGGGRDHSKVIPLCVLHHTGGGEGVAFHANKTAWERIHGTEAQLMRRVVFLLGSKQ